MTLPWVTTANSIATSQTIYNRTVSVHRQKTVAGNTDAVGNVGYSGAEQSTSSAEGEAVLFTGLAASVQLQSAGRATSTGKSNLPADATTKPTWYIFIQATLPQYSIRDRDIVIDDEGYRYEVGANEWNTMGYRLSTVRQEV